MKSNTLVIACLFAILIPSLTSCKKATEAKMPTPEIKVVQVIQKDVPVYSEFVGQVYGEQDVPIRARVEGYLEGIHFREGFKVNENQLLYTIDPQPFQARVNSQKSRVAEAETMLAKSESDLNRIRPLAAVNAVSESDLDAAEAQYEAALSSVKAAKANLESAEIELGYTKIYSPIEGIIGKTEAKQGEFVGRDPNPVILNTVSSTGKMLVNFYLTEADYLFLFREGQGRRQEEKDRAVLELILADGTTYEHKGQVDFIDRGVNSSTGSMLIQGSFPNPNLMLRPGMFSKVKVAMLQKENALLVPQRCVKELQGQYSVFVVDSVNKVAARQIKVSNTIGDLWLVTEGLNPEDQVVLEGLQKVRTGMEIKPVLTEFESQANPE